MPDDDKTGVSAYGAWLRVAAGVLGLLGVAGYGSHENTKLSDKYKAEIETRFTQHLTAMPHKPTEPIWNRINQETENREAKDDELENEIRDLRERVRWLESKHGR